MYMAQIRDSKVLEKKLSRCELFLYLVWYFSYICNLVSEIHGNTYIIDVIVTCNMCVLFVRLLILYII